MNYPNLKNRHYTRKQLYVLRARGIVFQLSIIASLFMIGVFTTLALSIDF